MINFAGKKFRNPIVIASGPLTSKIDLLKRAEDAGAAGASIKLTFNQVPFSGKLRAFSLPDKGLLFGVDRRLNKDEGLELMRKGKEETSLVLMANITNPSSDLEQWISLARSFQEAGADIIEANMTCPHIGLPSEKIGASVPNGLRSGAHIGQRPELCFSIVRALKENLSIPVVPKLYSNHERFLESVRAVEEAGADAVSFGGVLLDCLPAPDIFNNGKPSIDLLDKVSLGIITGNPMSKYSTFGKIARVRLNSSIPILGVGGVTAWSDIIEMIMWGANAVGICTCVMWHGFDIITKFVDEINRYLEEANIDSLESIRGTAVKYLTQSTSLTIVDGYAVIDGKKCRSCGSCLKIGHCLAVELNNGKYHIDKDKCIGCSVCVNICTSGAISMRSTRDEIVR